MAPRTTKRKVTENDGVENARAAKRPTIATRFSARLRARPSLGAIQPNEFPAAAEPSPVASPSASAEGKKEPVNRDVSPSLPLAVKQETPTDLEVLQSILTLLKKEDTKPVAATVVSATTDEVVPTDQVASLDDAADDVDESSIYDTLRSYSSISATEADALAKFFKAQASPIADDTTAVIHAYHSLSESEADVISDFLEAQTALVASVSARDDEVASNFFRRIGADEAATLAKFFDDQAVELQVEEELNLFMSILKDDH